MSEIKLSPKHGLNPTIPVCFWCGKEKGEIALMGHIGDGRKGEDFEAPHNLVLDYEPCEICKDHMSLGVTVMEATSESNVVTSVEIQEGVYPTGRWVVITPDAAKRLFGIPEGITKCFLEDKAFREIFAADEEGN